MTRTFVLVELLLLVTLCALGKTDEAELVAVCEIHNVSVGGLCSINCRDPCHGGCGKAVDCGTAGHITALYAQGKGIVTLPPSIGNLVHLTALDLSQNKLVFLPQEFGSLGSLQNLNIEMNLIDHLPQSFSSLSSLKNLVIHDNLLEEMPDLSNLTSLNTM